ncbi:MAG: SRPBCC family protein [Gammaproteobacteria bacterium]
MANAKDTTSFETLHIRRLIPASPDRVFSAWTDPDQLKMWWGPKGVRCLSAEVELRVGGHYRIANELPDGSVLWIAGEFETIERPDLLIYTWVVETASPTTERVSVQFDKHEQGTEIILRHEFIATTALRDRHQQGWIGCMDGLIEHLTK